MEKEKVTMKKRTGNYDTSITVRITEDLKNEIKRQAEELDMPLSMLIKVVLEQYFK